MSVTAAEGKKYFAERAEAAIKTTAGTGIFPSVKLAMAAVESSWGQSPLYRISNNSFSIKRFGYPDFVTIASDTTAGQLIQYRKYKDDYQSFLDHTKFLQDNSRYKTAGVFTAKTPEEQIDRIIINGKYSESPWEANVVKNLIKYYDLKQYDISPEQYEKKNCKPPQ